MAEDKQTAADAEGPRWDREEVPGRNCFTMANNRGDEDVSTRRILANWRH